jgi:ABC-2 type transport system permease protein
VLPVAVLCLAAAVLALGWVPRAVLPVGALPGAGGFVLQVLADIFAWLPWVRQLSPFSHLAAVPATGPNWPGTIGLLAVASLLAGAGVAGYRRRDLRG